MRNAGSFEAGDLPEPVEGLLKEPIWLGWYRVAEPPVRYRAYDLEERLPS